MNKLAISIACVALSTAASAQPHNEARLATNQPDAEPQAKAASTATPDYLVLYFDSGSTTVRPQDRALLDKAARLYRDAHPVIMIVAGGADSVGPALTNLVISDARARTVLKELVARGIPVERFQVLAKGETEPSVPAPDGVAEPGNRTVEIHWR